MTPRNDEELLQQAFEELRRDTRRRGAVPDAGAMLARARAEVEAEAASTVDSPPSLRTRRRAMPGVRRAGWLSLAAAAAATTLFLLDGSSRGDREFERLVAEYSADMAGGAWRSPTDGLLRTPGVDLGAVPSVGSSLRSLPAPPPRTGGNGGGRDS